MCCICAFVSLILALADHNVSELDVFGVADDRVNQAEIKAPGENSFKIYM